ncbi:hypothetical protein ERJ75_001551200 [Trypanosoma vivax]|nr:hypothetical protein ERJ75_001551200 [Trypanosoma vivax]
MPGNRHIKQWALHGRRKQLVRPKTADRPRDKTLGNAGKQSHEEKPPNQRRKRKVPGASWRSKDGEMCCATCKPEERTLQDGARRRDEQRQTGSAAVGFLFSGAASSGETRSVFFTTKVGRVSADGCLSLCRCLRAGGSRLLPWRALGCATPAATALCDTAGRNEWAQKSRKCALRGGGQAHSSRREGDATQAKRRVGALPVCSRQRRTFWRARNL